MTANHIVNINYFVKMLIMTICYYDYNNVVGYHNSIPKDMFSARLCKHSLPTTDIYQFQPLHQDGWEKSLLLNLAVQRVHL